MDGTPKLQRKASLSLSTRLNHKRHSASPQNRLKTSTSNGAINTRELNTNRETLQRSPSVISICSDGGIECTPPHKKMIMNLDDSLDYSPKVFDSSFSPTCLLSQTLAIDSPEVGWKWSRHTANGGSRVCGIDDNSTRTPDSAYAADSSFASAGSSSTEVGNVRTRGDSYQQRIAYDARREQELRRVEKTRAEEKLKQRCAKLQEQLKSAGTQSSKTKSQNNKDNIKNSSNSSSLLDVEMKSLSKSDAAVKIHTPEKIKKPELLNDFFNDSDSDCFLLEATQEIESKMEAKTQPAYTNFANNTPKSSTSSECTSIPHANSAPAATTTPPPPPPNVDLSSSNSTNKEKRSSFYMKFLEDDCPDDWFVSLDEVVLQATQTKKPRTSLQRYKSMPAETATKSNVSLNKKDSNGNCLVDSKPNSSKRIQSEDAATSSSNLSKMKRHSSTHTLSPAGTSYRSRRQL
ncbi:uncharacterized protein LOC119602286 [Lucilia sericata]|uniref:uncharacterized protein LOC119602286 n=1 Tax=Lucilia sericata TaxID=13632 RepID=UPI0018A825A7|nr:uncharacterized protein LOC119602286 [Lucilia sericata]